MSEFSNAFNAINEFFEGFFLVPEAMGNFVEIVPFLKFALGFSVVLGMITWLFKFVVRG